MNTTKYGTTALVFLALGLGGWVLHDLVLRTPTLPSTAATTGQVGAPAPLAITIPPARTPRVHLTLAHATRGAPSPRPQRVTGTVLSTSGPSPSPGTVVYLLPPEGGSVADDPPAGQPPVPVVLVTGPGPAAPPGPETPTDEGGPGASTANQVLASAGSIVFIGPNGQLTANTGTAQASGVVALNAADSSLNSGHSSASLPPGQQPGQQETSTADDQQQRDELSESGEQDEQAPSQTPTAGMGLSHANGTLLALLSPDDVDGRSVSFSGFEDHSVDVLGNNQIVTYDDSNVFINRDGQLNANTGDTDSSGLNAVDVVDSLVGSGNSGDGEGAGEDDGEEDEAEEDQSTLVPVPADGAGPGDPSAPTSGSSDDEDNAGADEATEDGVPDYALLPGTTFGTVTDEGASIASGHSSLVVGADGYDDVSIRTFGEQNVVSYDDSNVIIGGTGKVNAQIGDSDTGGAVVMGIYNSQVQAGCEGDLCYSK